MVENLRMLCSIKRCGNLRSFHRPLSLFVHTIESRGHTSSVSMMVIEGKVVGLIWVDYMYQCRCVFYGTRMDGEMKQSAGLLLVSYDVRGYIL